MSFSLHQKKNCLLYLTNMQEKVEFHLLSNNQHTESGQGHVVKLHICQLISYVENSPWMPTDYYWAQTHKVACIRQC